jgi:polyhydroxyalkanoate synthesis regulator phasin
MNCSAIKKPGSEQESTRLRLGELIQLADEFRHRGHRIRGDGRRILDDVLATLQTHSNSTQASTNSDIESNRRSYGAVRRELRSSWLRVDALIDDLMSSAADELYGFANIAESRIAACERAVHHRQVWDSAKTGHDNVGQHSEPNLDRPSAKSTEDL